MSANTGRHHPVPFWKIWANPITRRYAQSRLRPTELLIGCLIAVLLAGFFFFIGRTTGIHRLGLSAADAARAPLLPLFGLQGVILFMLGTGQVAGGMTAEADEGVLDYQRLAPMTPLSKVVGYLFGLPIREWAMFAFTLPFSIISMVQGNVPLKTALILYLVFFSAAILYHLAGLLSGTVIKNRRWAFLGSMGLVFILYTIMPQISRFGLVYFKYFTVNPVLESYMSDLVPLKMGMEDYRALIPQARFFALEFPQEIFTLISQGVLMATMGTMLWRRWRKNESHLLGKLGALGLFGWLQLVLVGNALPLIKGGELFPSREFNRRFGIVPEEIEQWAPDPFEALVMIGLFGVTTLIFIWLLAFIITPSHETQVRGRRRTRKLGKHRLSNLSDPSSSTPWIAAMAFIGTIGWVLFARGLLHSHWFPEIELQPLAPLAFFLVLLSGGLIIQSIIEMKGNKFTSVVIILGLALPLMAGALVGIISDDYFNISTWIIGMSPIIWPAYGSVAVTPLQGSPAVFFHAAPYAFWFWQVMAALLAIKLMGNLKKRRQEVADSVS